MKTLNVLLLLALAQALAGCDVDEPPPPPLIEGQQADPLPNSNVFSSDIRALEKAKNEEKVIQQQKANMDKQLQDQGG